MIAYHPVVVHTTETRKESVARARDTVDQFERLNDIRPQLLTTADFPKEVNKYWYFLWVWDMVPDDVEYIMVLDSKVLPIRTLPPLPELKFAAVMDRHDRVNQGMYHSEVIKQTQKYFQMHMFVAHRDTRVAFDKVKLLEGTPKFEKQGGLGFDGRACYTPLNEEIQSRFEVHELPREWNWNITYEKQYYYDYPYMINFNANEHGTWAYHRYVKHLTERIEAFGGNLDGPPTPGWVAHPRDAK